MKVMSLDVKLKKQNKPVNKPVTVYTPSESTKPDAREIRSEFLDYFGGLGELENWQRLCRDLGVNNGDLGSKTKCKKVTTSCAGYSQKIDRLIRGSYRLSRKSMSTYTMSSKPERLAKPLD